MNTKAFSVVTLALAAFSFSNLVSAGVCEYADTTYAKVTTGTVGTGVAAGVGLNVAGVTALAHSSGAAIVATVSTGYLAGTLGAIGAVAGFIAAPVTLIVGGVAVAAAGGTIAYCHYTKDEKSVPPSRAGSALGKVK